MNRSLYSGYFTYYSRDLRKNSTCCELILWDKIRKRQLQGVQFLRQKPIGPYIVDFYSRNPPLVIEIDGLHHGFGEQKEKDTGRDAYLNGLGITVLRFTNQEILSSISGVLEAIMSFLDIPPRPTP